MHLLEANLSETGHNFLLVNPAEDMERTRDMLKAAYPNAQNIWEATGREDMERLLGEVSFDFIILDIAVNGFDHSSKKAVALLSKIAAIAPVLIYTSVDDADLAIPLIKAGAQDYLVKGRGNFHTLRRIVQYSLERAKAKRELQDSEELLKIFIQHTPAAVAMFDREIRYLLFSDRWLTDYDLDWDIAGKCHYEVFPNMPQRWKDLHQRCLKGEILKNERDVFSREDGTTDYVKWELVPWFKGGEVAGIIMFTEMVTDKILTQLSLEQANTRLEQAIALRTRELEKALRIAEESNRAKTDFFTNITHELRTPLHAILNFSDFAREKIDKAPTEKILDYLEKINRSGHRLLNLVNDVLDLAKTRDMTMEIRPEPQNLHAIVNDVVEELRSLSDKRGLSIVVSTATENVQALADRQRIAQVIVNLLSNAYKFTAELSQVLIRLQDAPEEGYLLISVTDQGEGIPEEDLQLVFDEFSQSNKVRSGAFTQGTGLGLAICRQIVQAHGGRIWAENEPSGGAKLQFTLPRTAA